MPDFSILQQPNFANAALGGLQAGQALGKQRRLDQAMSDVDLERPETLAPLMRVDPDAGAALANVALKMHSARQEQAALSAKADYLTALGGAGVLGDASASSSAPTGTALSTAPQPSSSDSKVEGDIVVTAPTRHNDLEAARAALIKADPDAYIQLETHIAGMGEAQRKHLDAVNDTFGATIEAAKGMPYEQRKTYIQNQRAQLIQHGVPQDRIDAFDPTDGNIVGIENQVLGIKGVLERQDKDRTYGLQREKFDHDVSQDAATLGVSRGNLAVSQGNLALSRQREGRVAATPHPGRASAADVPTAKASVGGKAFVKINGKWIAQ